MIEKTQNNKGADAYKAYPGMEDLSFMSGDQQEPRKEFEFSERDFDEISQLVYKASGIVLRKEKKPMVYARLARRLRQLNIGTFREYCEFVAQAGNDQEFVNLINAITTNLTRFFREDHHFEHLSQSVLKPYFEAHQKDPQKHKRFRIWSSAASSGEEPYSLAMTVLDAMPSSYHGDFKILATDIDTNMIERCQAGIYKDGQGIPDKYLRSYVESNPTGGIRMKNEIRNLLTFKPLNLLHDWPFSGTFDVVFCRNVVIYFDKPTQQVLFEKMAEVIKPGGWLYIGHSESLYKITDRFRLVGRTIYQREDD